MRLQKGSNMKVFRREDYTFERLGFRYCRDMINFIRFEENKIIVNSVLFAKRIYFSSKIL